MPRNQFANQESGISDEIEEFCQVNYGVSFPMFEKIDVNGRNTHPVFKFLKRRLLGFLGSRIKRIFTKFVIDGKGRPVQRLAPTIKPAKRELIIQKTLKKHEHSETSV